MIDAAGRKEAFNYKDLAHYCSVLQQRLQATEMKLQLDNDVGKSLTRKLEELIKSIVTTMASLY
jgi:hypothetical protein